MFLTPLTAGLELAGTIASETYNEFALFQPDRPRERLERQYTNDASEFCQVGDSRIHYRDEGPRDAPTVLLLHGTYSSLHTWDDWVEQLTDRLRVIRLDMPGFGLTGPRDSGPHTLRHLVTAVGEFCDVQNLSEVAVAGNSLGGAVGWRLAVERPHVVSKLLLLNAGGATLLSNLAENITAFGSDMVPRFVTPRMMIRLLLNDAYGDTSHVTTDLVTRYHDLLMASGNRRAVIEIARNYRADHYDEGTGGLGLRTPRFPSAYNPSSQAWDNYDISDVTVPTLFQWGCEDEWLHVEFGRELASPVPDDTFLTYDGVGHVPMEESPAETARDAAQFILHDESDDEDPKVVTA